MYLRELIERIKHAKAKRDVDPDDTGAALVRLTNILRFVIDHYQNTHATSINFYYPWYILCLQFAHIPAKDAMYQWLGFLSKYGWHSNVNDGIIGLFSSLSGISKQDYIDTQYFNVFATVDINKFLTGYGKDHYDDVLAIIHDLLNRDYQISNTNYIFKMYGFEEGKIVFREYNDTLSLEAYSTSRYHDIGRRFDGIYTLTSTVPMYSTGVRDLYIKSIAREAESILKDESGIRDRWISERVLFRQIESAFTNLNVQQHAHPSFLGRQHYDVYIPELKIALEYQGEQHFVPIPFFWRRSWPCCDTRARQTQEETI